MGSIGLAHHLTLGVGKWPPVGFLAAGQGITAVFRAKATPERYARPVASPWVVFVVPACAAWPQF